MTLPEGVGTFAGRLATFEGSRRLAKRRASAAKKKTASSVAWPHKSPTPEQLAKAGFFYQPTSTSDDNVQCFLCEGQMDGWEPNDNPAYEHLVHAGDCGWAVNASINQRISESKLVDEDPLSERLLEARRATFKESWPHEEKRGWKCKVQKMIEAGWCYDPTPETDDEVQCFYCNLRLDGWEPKDNPLEEHRRRSPDCSFFDLADKFATTRKGKRGKASRGSKASIKSRVSTQSISATAEPPSFASLGAATLDDDDTVLTTATAATATSMASKRGKGKSKAAPKANRKNAKTQKAADNSIVSTTMHDESAATEQEQPVRATRAARGKKRDTSQSTKANDESTLQALAPPKKNSRAKPKKQVERVSDDESQLHSELLDAVRRDSQDSNLKTFVGTKRTSDGMPKSEPSFVIMEDPPTPAKAKPAKKTTAKRAPRKVTKAADAQSSQIDVDASDAPSRVSKPAPKAKGGRAKKVKSPSPEPEPEPNYEDDFDDDIELHDTNLEDFPAPPSSAAKAKVSTPQRSYTKSAQNNMTPSPSPQSSDAENVPPSARPSYHPASIQRQAVRVPLAPLASTPTTSPSKRNVIQGGLSSAFPWEPADLETVFMMSTDEEQEFKRLNGIATDTYWSEENINYSNPKMMDETVRRVKSSLTSPEKKMTVEQWIRFNAEQGEKRLKAECERLVGVFETQGMRAMRAIEGVECGL